MPEDMDNTINPDQKPTEEVTEEVASEMHYGADDLRILEGLEAVRMRPAMYIGDTGSRGLHHLFTEVIDNSIDEHLAGYCNNITVILGLDDTVSVADDGRGIPTGIHSEAGVSGVEVALTKLHAGGKFGGGGYKVSGGLHGVGVSCVNALSEWMEVRVCQENQCHYQRFVRGVPDAPLTVIGAAEGTGTTVKYFADSEIFSEIKYHPDIFVSRIRELAYLNKGISITFINEQAEDEAMRTRTFKYENGIAEFVEYLNKNKNPLHKVVYLSNERDETAVEVALQYNESYQENILTYTNNIHTQEGGTHLSGFKTAMTRVINNYARKSGALKEKDVNLSGDDVREGIAAIISVKVMHPQFEGQTKTKLGNGEVEGIVNSIVGEKFQEFLEENPTAGKRIVDKALTSQRARDAARKAADMVKRQSAMENSSLPGKLADCIERDASKCELFIVEGQSAGGNAKAGRDRRCQAILPLRGKILNVEKARMDRALENEEIKSLVAALGTGITHASMDTGDDENGELDFGEETTKSGNGKGNGGPTFDKTRLRYDKVIIMTDADVDGSHIRTLLLTFFYRYMKPLVDEGHIYIAQPPFYRIKMGKDKIFYAKNDEELESLTKGLGHKKDLTVTRFKGLGEMNAEDLADTTMNQEARSIAQVTVEDAIDADEMFTVLLGDDVDPRKKFIEAHAKEVTNVDWHA